MSDERRMQLLCRTTSELVEMILQLESLVWNGVEERNRLRSEWDSTRAELADIKVKYDLCYERMTEFDHELAALQAANEWHPASEPPEIGDPKSYLVCVRGDGYAIARYTPYDTQDNRDWLSDAYGFLEITHWRELPAPPEVEE